MEEEFKLPLIVVMDSGNHECYTNCNEYDFKIYIYSDGDKVQFQIKRYYCSDRRLEIETVNRDINNLQDIWPNSYDMNIISDSPEYISLAQIYDEPRLE